jgi:hypothetical protein
MSEYSHNEVKRGKIKIVGTLLRYFGIFIIVSALMLFPSESSWEAYIRFLEAFLMVVYISLFDIGCKKKFYAFDSYWLIIVLFGFFQY